jgi:IS66 C-terminal element
MSVLPPAETERHRTVTWKAPIIDVAKIASMSGLEYLQHLIDDDLPPPIAELLNFRLTNLYSLVSCARVNGLEPYAYLRYLFEEVPKASTVEALEALLPWNVKPVLRMRVAAAA